MNNHKMTFMRFEKTRHKARCQCGWTTFELPSYQAVEDAVRVHREEIERIKAHLRKSNPSMTDQAQYYRDMVNLAPDPKDRAMWRQLADELDTRLGRNAPPSEQLSIFEV